MRVHHWNRDKAHRCPLCHTVMDDGDPPMSRWAVYECCKCGIWFARRPRLARALPVRRCKDIATGTCPHNPCDDHGRDWPAKYRLLLETIEETSSWARNALEEEDSPYWHSLSTYMTLIGASARQASEIARRLDDRPGGGR